MTREELEKLLAAATPLPWFIARNANTVGDCTPEDAALIVAAVNALPELLERVRRLGAIEVAARDYFNGYMQDEAADDGPEMTGCGMDQHVKAAALRAALKEPGQ